jgi:hypothetical protein
MAEEFRLQADELQNVANGLLDVKAQIQEIVSTARGQVAAEGTPWQFSGAPAGIAAQVEDIQDAVDPSNPNSVGAAVGHLSDYLDTIVKVVTESDEQDA